MILLLRRKRALKRTTWLALLVLSLFFLPASGCAPIENWMASGPKVMPVVPEHCLGAVGIKCQNVVGNVGFITVGSILHDNCCVLNHPNGYFCHNGGSIAVCKPEWNKALRDSLELRQWSTIFTGKVDDITPVPARASDLPTTWETVATSQLAAPDGTELDASDAAFCAAKTFREPPAILARQGFGTCGAGPALGFHWSHFQIFLAMGIAIMVLAVGLIILAGRSSGRSFAPGRWPWRSRRPASRPGAGCW